MSGGQYVLKATFQVFQKCYMKAELVKSQKLTKLNFSENIIFGKKTKIEFSRFCQKFHPLMCFFYLENGA